VGGEFATADLQEPSEALAVKTSHLKDKLAKLASEMMKRLIPIPPLIAQESYAANPAARNSIPKHDTERQPITVGAKTVKLQQHVPLLTRAGP
jgi:hypothetical protein